MMSGLGMVSQEHKPMELRPLGLVSKDVAASLGRILYLNQESGLGRAEI